MEHMHGSPACRFAINAAALDYTVFAFEPMAKNHGAIRRTLCDIPDMQERLTLITKVRMQAGGWG